MDSRESKTVYEVIGDRLLNPARNLRYVLVAACKLIAAGHRPAALNFASAKNPGSGFLQEPLSGSVALPESARPATGPARIGPLANRMRGRGHDTP